MRPTECSTQEAQACDAADKDGKKKQSENTPVRAGSACAVVADTPAIAATKQALFSLTGELNRFL
jgi:hypothetical protein